MKIRNNLFRFLAVVLAMSCMLTILLPISTAAETRTSTNGYSYTSVTYNGKNYTISLGVGGTGSKVAYVTAYCPIDGIKIKVGDVTAKFDTKNFGYITNVGNGITDRTSAQYNYFSITSPTLVCSKGTNQVVKVLQVTNNTVFKSVNNGQDANLLVGFNG